MNTPGPFEHGREPVRVRGDRMSHEKKAPVSVTPEPGSRLESLLAEYDVAKARADEAAARLKTITDGIKAETLAQELNAVDDRFDITSPYLAAPLRLSYVESWRLDAKRMKAEDPAMYVTYAVKGGSWQLRKAAG